jgi:hypothetical protein
MTNHKTLASFDLSDPRPGYTIEVTFILLVSGGL